MGALRLLLSLIAILLTMNFIEKKGEGSKQSQDFAIYKTEGLPQIRQDYSINSLALSTKKTRRPAQVNPSLRVSSGS